VLRALVVFSGFAVLACHKEDRPPPPPTVTPPTIAEAEKFAKEFAKHMMPCDQQQISIDVDGDLMIARTLGGRDIGRREAAGIRSAIVSQIGPMLCQAVTAFEPEGTTQSYVYLRTRNVNGQIRPLLRLAGDNGVTYHELELDKHTDGTIRIVDIYLYSTGELMSELLGTALEGAVKDSAMLAIGDVRLKLNAGQPKEAHAKLHQLPEHVRRMRVVMLLDVFVSGMLDDDIEYARAIDAFEKAYPNDGALDLIQIDQYFMKKKFDKVLAMIDRLDKRLGGDPYLDVQRASALLEAGRKIEAVAAAKRATEREPTLQQAWWGLLTAQAAADDTTGALATLTVLRDRFKVVIDADALHADARFETLVESKQFKAWIVE
jgi:hypothetical protein